MPRAPKMWKSEGAVVSAENSSMGRSPDALANREFNKPIAWCPKKDIEFDPACDPDNPKNVLYKDIVKAACVIKSEIQPTPLLRSRCCVQFQMELNYKLEIFHRTGSFLERGAIFSLLMLNDEQKEVGVITASTGNWGMALSYHGRRLNIKVTVVLPISTPISVSDRCQDFGADVIVHGENMAQAKRRAFEIKSDIGATYINSYDHSHCIAAGGSIGLEVLEQLPNVDVILVPVGGGGLLAGIATAVKTLKPGVLIYGVEPDKCCSFFKAMDNNRPYQTVPGRSIASALAVPTAGVNAFYTAQSLVDKMVLVDDDWITRGILHMIEEEKLIVEGAGATALGALLAVPDVLTELKGKTVACIISGGNIENPIISRAIERAKAVDGRIIKVTVTLPVDGTKEAMKVMSMISNVGANVLQCYFEHAWLTTNEFYTIYLTLICETQNLDQACQLKRVMDRIFPDQCDFLEEPFSPIPICICFPKKRF